MNNEATVKTNAEKFYESLQYRQSLHKRVYTIDRLSGEDYYPNQEQKDLMLYYSFMNSSAWDMINEVLQSEDDETLKLLNQEGNSLTLLRKRSVMHDDM